MMKKWLTFLLFDLTALLLGALLCFAFAPYGVFPLAIIAPAGLLALWLNASPKRAFGLGFFFGLGLFGCGIYWVFHSIHVIAGVPTLLASLITGALIVVLAFFPAIVGYLTNRYFPINNPPKLICAFPAIWVFSEWIRAWIFSGFPWLFLGYSQTDSPLKGYAPLLSVYGVSLAVAISSGLLVNAIIQFKQKKYVALYLSLFALTTLWIVGSLCTLIPWTQPSGNTIQVSLVQGNIPQTLKWSPDHLQLSFDRYTELTEPLWAKDRLIIWPEAAIPMPLQNARAFINQMDKKAQANHAHLILGIPIQAEDKTGYYNAIVTLGKEKSVYLKRRLVPFGEYVPFSHTLSGLFDFMNVPMSNMLAGQFFQGPLSLGHTKILSSICYEIAFPELIRSGDKTIGILLTITNDAWFGDSAAQAQHLQMAEMRAIEFGRPLLFASNDGITAIIDPSGKIEAVAPQHKIYVLNSSVQPTYGLTPWMRNGMGPIAFILIGLLIIAIRAKKIALMENNYIYIAENKPVENKVNTNNKS